MPRPASPWTPDLVRALPDDGNRYELIAGQLLVTPAPRGSHQVAVSELEARLRTAVLATPYHVLHSPADLALGDEEILQPDVFVYRTASGRSLREWSDITEIVLVVEVLSPSTAVHDRGIKRRRYQRASVPEYWIVDLDARLVERWRPDDERPEVIAEQLAWRAPETIETLTIDLPAFFGTILGPD